MAASGLGAVTLAGIGVAVNAADVVIRRKGDPFPMILAGGFVMAAVAFTAAVRADVARGIAVLFLVGSLVLHGSSLFGFASTIVRADPPTSDKEGK